MDEGWREDDVDGRWRTIKLEIVTQFIGLLLFAIYANVYEKDQQLALVISSCYGGEHNGGCAR